MSGRPKWILLGLAIAAAGGVLALLLERSDSASSRAGSEASPSATGSTMPTATEDSDGATATVGTGERPPAPTIPGPTATATAATPNPAPPPPPYALPATRQCLRSVGFTVSEVRSEDPRLRALGDLAQQTSLEVRLADRTLGLAFGDTRLLSSLLAVPNDPYRLEVRRNVLIMYRPAARREAALVRSCLRP